MTCDAAQGAHVTNDRMHEQDAVHFRRVWLHVLASEDACSRLDEVLFMESADGPHKRTIDAPDWNERTSNDDLNQVFQKTSNQQSLPGVASDQP